MTKAESTQKPVACLICGHTSHILVRHLKETHNLTIEAYRMQHPNALVWSAKGLSALRAAMPDVAALPRPRKAISLNVIFPKLARTEDLTGDYAAFAEPGELTPTLDPRYVFPVQQTLDVLAVLRKPERSRVYIKGFSGTGKTAFVHNLAAALNAELVEWNADGFQQRATLVGQWIVKDGETVWQDGILPTAMKRGAWLLINELDTIDPATLNILKPVLEDPARLVLLENGGEVVRAHPDFRVIATANTWSRGDDTGLFVNTNIQSDADLRRWNARIGIDYMTPEQEMTAMMGIFPDADSTFVGYYIKSAELIRKSFMQGRIDKAFSFAELMNWYENTLALSTDPIRAAKVSFLDSCSADVQRAITEIINASFDRDVTQEQTKRFA